MPQDDVKDIVSLRLFFERILEETNRRNEERFRAQETAINAALLAQKTAIDAALAAADRAVTKAEVAAEKRFESQNEFRGQLKDQQANFVTRAELASIEKRFDEKIVALERENDNLRKSRSLIEGEKAGKENQQRLFMVVLPSLIGALIFIIATIVAVAYAVRR